MSLLMQLTFKDLNRVRISDIALIDVNEVVGLVDTLLVDRTTEDNILWGTDSYTEIGYSPTDNIQSSHIRADDSVVIPRLEKDGVTQKARTKGKAEVFTPLWVIKKQNDPIEKEFVGLPLEDYLSKTWLEITCGEGPYMCSRYDPVSGEHIDIDSRVGFVDRKLQRLSREVQDEHRWISLAKLSYESSYGYEFQGDSLYLARENMLHTFIEHYHYKFGKLPEEEVISEFAQIISYNVFQMDGLSYKVPLTDVSVLLKDWDTGEMYSFESILS